MLFKEKEKEKERGGKEKEKERERVGKEDQSRVKWLQWELKQDKGTASNGKGTN